MGKYSSKDLDIHIDDSSGTPQDIAAYVTELSGFDREALIEDTTAFGAADMANAFSGVRKVGDITIKGFYDDTSTTGPDALLNDIGCAATSGGTRTFKVGYGSTKTSAVEVVIKKYTRTPVREKLTTYQCVLTPTGAVTEV